VLDLRVNFDASTTTFNYSSDHTLSLHLALPTSRQHVVRARLARNIPAASGRADFVRVRLEERDGEPWAVPVFGKSNSIFTLVRSEGVVEVPLNSNGVPAGDLVTVVMDT
jgi:molybdopterin molybdotransferase